MMEPFDSHTAERCSIAELRASIAHVADALHAPADVTSPDDPMELPASHRLLGAIERRFALDAIERRLLHLALAFEIDPELDLPLAAPDTLTGARVTPTLVERWLGGAALDALREDGTLLREGLLVKVDDAPWHRRSLRLADRVLRYLLGEREPDATLGLFLRPLVHAAVTSLPCPSELLSAVRVVGATGTPRIVQLCGADRATSLGIAAALAGALDQRPMHLATEQVPAQEDVRARWWRLVRREVRLLGGVLVVDLLAHDEASVLRQLARDDVPAIVIAHPDARLSIGDLRLDVPPPSSSEVRVTLASALPDAAPSELDRLAGEFRLGLSELDAVTRQLRARPDPSRPAAERAWDLCREQVQARMDGLAQRVTPDATWDDLVLPTLQSQALRELLAHVRQRFKVHHEWAMGRAGNRGLGVSALFAGPSGTGKTTAAEVLARELRMDLHRIDLSAVVSKYIGETEKNLRRVFDAAEAGGSILLFDEADALFGKRSEVRDSHDRYANMEVSYLLQRVEAFRGLAILTTNLRDALDGAFLRRLRFVVDFPFPDATQRAALWARMFPPTVPTEGLDPGRLARLQVTGGVIRNIALHAAFLAADAGEPVRSRHVLQAARRECAKHDRPVTDAEARWLSNE